MIDKIADKINIHYIVSEQQPTLTLFREILAEALTEDNQEQQTNFRETKSEKQNYNNCETEVLENFL